MTRWCAWRTLGMRLKIYDLYGAMPSNRQREVCEEWFLLMRRFLLRALQTLESSSCVPTSVRLRWLWITSNLWLIPASRRRKFSYPNKVSSRWSTQESVRYLLLSRVLSPLDQRHPTSWSCGSNLSRQVLSPVLDLRLRRVPRERHSRDSEEQSDQYRSLPEGMEWRRRWACRRWTSRTFSPFPSWILQRLITSC